MYYVLFHYLKGQKEKDFRRFRSEDDVIDFLKKNSGKISVFRTLKTDIFYSLALVSNPETMENLMNPEPEEEPEKTETVVIPAEEGVIRAALDKADKVIEKGKEMLENQRAGWETCPECGIAKISPGNKTGKCSKCQRPKGKRKYDMTKRNKKSGI